MLKLRYISQSRLLQLPFRNSPLSGRSLFLSNRLSAVCPISNHVRWLSQEIKIDDKQSAPAVSGSEQRDFNMTSTHTNRLFFSQASEPALLGTFHDLHHVVSLLEAAQTPPERALLLRHLAKGIASSDKILDEKSYGLLFPFVESVFVAQPKPSAAILADAATMVRHWFIQGLIAPDKLSIYEPVISETIQAAVNSVDNRPPDDITDDVVKEALDTLRLIRFSKGWYKPSPENANTLLQVAFHHSKENPAHMLNALQVANKMKATFATLPKICEAAALSMLLNPSISLPMTPKDVIDSSSATTSQPELENNSKPIIPIDRVSAVQFLQGLRHLKFDLASLPVEQRSAVQTSLTNWYQNIFKSVIEDMQHQSLELSQKRSNTDTVVQTMASMASVFKSSKNLVTEELMYEAMMLTLPTVSSAQLLNICLSLQMMRIPLPSVPQKLQLALLDALTRNFQTCDDPVSVSNMRSLIRYVQHFPSHRNNTATLLTTDALREAMITHFLMKHPILTVGERSMLSRELSHQVVDVMTMLANLGSKWEDLPLSLQQVYADGMVRCLHSLSTVRVKHLEDALIKLDCPASLRLRGCLVERLFDKAVSDPWSVGKKQAPLINTTAMDLASETAAIESSSTVEDPTEISQGGAAGAEGEGSEGGYAQLLFGAASKLDVQFKQLSVQASTDMVRVALKYCTTVEPTLLSLDRSLTTWSTLINMGLTRGHFQLLKGHPSRAPLTLQESEEAMQRWYSDAVHALHSEMMRLQTLQPTEDKTTTTTTTAKTTTTAAINATTNVESARRNKDFISRRLMHLLQMSKELPIQFSPPSSLSHEQRPRYQREMEEIMIYCFKGEESNLDGRLERLVGWLSDLGWKWSFFQQRPEWLETKIWETMFFISSETGMPSEELMRQRTLSLATLEHLATLQCPLPTIAIDASPVLHPSKREHYATCSWKSATFADLPFVLTQQSQQIQTAVNVAPMLRVFWDSVYLRLVESSPLTMSALKGNVPSPSPRQRADNPVALERQREFSEFIRKEWTEKKNGRAFLGQVFDHLTTMLRHTPPVMTAGREERFRVIAKDDPDYVFEELATLLTLMNRVTMTSQNMWRGVYFAALKRPFDVAMGIDPETGRDLRSPSISISQAIFLMELFQKIYNKVWKVMSTPQRKKIVHMFDQLQQQQLPQPQPPQPQLTATGEQLVPPSPASSSSSSSSSIVRNSTTLMTPAEEIMSPLLQAAIRGQTSSTCGAWDMLKRSTLQVINEPEAFARILRQSYQGHPQYLSSSTDTTTTDDSVLRWSSKHPFYFPFHHPLTNIVDTLDVSLDSLPMSSQELESLLMDDAPQWMSLNDPETALSLVTALKQLRMSWKTLEPAFAYWIAHELATSLKDAPLPIVAKAARNFSVLAYDLPWHQYDPQQTPSSDAAAERDQQLMTSALYVCEAILARVQQHSPVDFFQASAINTFCCFMDHFLPQHVTEAMYTKAFNLNGQRPSFTHPGTFALIPADVRSPALASRPVTDSGTGTGTGVRAGVGVSAGTREVASEDRSLQSVQDYLSQQGISWVKYETWLKDWVRVYYSEEMISSAMAEQFTRLKQMDQQVAIHPKIVIDPKFVALESGYEFIAVSLRVPPPSSATSSTSTAAPATAAAAAAAAAQDVKIPVAFVSIVFQQSLPSSTSSSSAAAVVASAPSEGPSPAESSSALSSSSASFASSALSTSSLSTSSPSVMANATEAKPPLSLYQEMHQIMYSRLFPHASFFYLTISPSTVPETARKICADIINTPMYQRLMQRLPPSPPPSSRPYVKGRVRASSRKSSTKSSKEENSSGKRTVSSDVKSDKESASAATKASFTKQKQQKNRRRSRSTSPSTKTPPPSAHAELAKNDGGKPSHQQKTTATATTTKKAIAVRRTKVLSRRGGAAKKATAVDTDAKKVPDSPSTTPTTDSGAS